MLASKGAITQANRTYILKHSPVARVAPISDSVIGGMLASKSAITQANRTYILKGSLFAICCPCKLNLIWQLWAFLTNRILLINSY